MKILSIDFDYFQDVPIDVLLTYPDGVDSTAKVSEIVWAGHYAAQKNGEIEAIGLLEEQFEKLKQILLQQDSSVPVTLAGSHVNAYDFIHVNVPEEASLFLYNVDMHHDIYNDNPNLDCGNWIRFIKEEYENFN